MNPPPSGAAESDSTASLGVSLSWGQWFQAVVVVALAAMLCGPIAPPLNLHWLHWAAYLPVFWVLQPHNNRHNAFLGYVYGLVSLAVIFRWLIDTIVLFSNIPSPLAFGILLLFAGVFGLPWVAIFGSVMPTRRAFGRAWVWIFPTVLVAVELLSSFVLLFPFQHGVAHYQNLPIWQLASITGVWGLSWLVGLTNAALAECLYARREGQPFPFKTVAAAIAIPSVIAIWGVGRVNALESELRQAPTLRIAQLQSPHGMTYRMSRPSRVSWDEWVSRTRRVRSGTVDLVIWPEGASPYDLSEGLAFKIVSDLSKSGDFEMVIGGGTRVRVPDPEIGESRVQMFNSVFFFDTSGELRLTYDKMIPLPFGEYLPWGLGWLDDYVTGIGDFRAGKEPVVYRSEAGVMATPICYEAIFGRTCRQFPELELLVNVTNDAWFGDTAAPHLHGMLAALRATELGVPMIRSAYSGMSFVVEPHGHLYAETEPFTEAARIVTVRNRDFPTLYRRWGDWFAWLCVVLAGGAFVLAPWRRSPNTRRPRVESPSH